MSDKLQFYAYSAVSLNEDGTMNHDLNHGLHADEQAVRVEVDANIAHHHPGATLVSYLVQPVTLTVRSTGAGTSLTPNFEYNA